MAYCKLPYNNHDPVFDPPNIPESQSNPLSEVDPVWSEDKSEYYTKEEVNQLVAGGGTVPVDLTSYAKNTYVDSQDIATLNSAKAYTDSKQITVNSLVTPEVFTYSGSTSFTLTQTPSVIAMVWVYDTNSKIPSLIQRSEISASGKILTISSSNITWTATTEVLVVYSVSVTG